jgi:steroid delta-isomerase-like uncharacterized protein
VKRTFIPFALGVVVLMMVLSAVPASARQAATPVSGDCAVTSPADNEAIVARWYDEALNGHDLAVLEEILAPGVMHDSAVFPDNPPPAVVLEQLFVGFPDLTYTVDDVISSEDKVVVRWTATGTNSGELFGEPATGAIATWTGINIFQIDCGLITAVWSEIDDAGRAAQLGG